VVAVVVLLGGALALASNDDGGGDDDTGAGSGDDRSADAADWEQIVPGGDCQCSDGSEFSFWVRKANPERVLLYLHAGGACFSAETCAQPDTDRGEGLCNATLRQSGDPRLSGAASSTLTTSAIHLPTTRSSTSPTARVTGT
jgi:hypothetical protein